MKLILAADRNWAIGNEGDLLCYIPGDLKYFKKVTADKVVVMGRATLESLPNKKPLPNRINYVLTRDENYKVEGAFVVHSYEELKKELEQYEEEDIFIIGGAKVYSDCLPMCDTCYITKIFDEFPADRHFVNLDKNDEFEQVWESDIGEENGIKYQFTEYRRK